MEQQSTTPMQGAGEQNATAAQQGAQEGFSRASRNRLNDRMLAHFGGETLFDAIARAVCRTGCLPRKELYEAWEVARRVHRRFRGGRVVDLACGHGLVGQILLLMDPTISGVLAVDRRIPPSARRLSDELQKAWPGLAGRLTLQEGDVDQVAVGDTDLVVSVHACGALSDLVLQKALAARARVAVLPCCHDLERCASGGLRGWLDGALAIDVQRAVRLEAAGYAVVTQTIPSDITPKNRLLMGTPPD
ncbi:hypothetical protein GMLC_34450 [Geomonas limicola]|uniref:Methyltransferase domain-containing protein n=1 Tax=Geomonas limicola TaxID=2740186 RepID=A0A6V8NBH6_9BACT|nr:methyltransferase [Geomonas limicola]GFO69866.1 hypothetical protein GMLC_34450 [Geomonas limicola]